MAPDPDGDRAEAGSLTSATPGTLGRSPKTSISYSIEYASRRLNGSFVYRSRLSLTRVLDGTQFTPGGSQNFGSLTFRGPMGWQVSRSYPMSFGG